MDLPPPTGPRYVSAAEWCIEHGFTMQDVIDEDERWHHEHPGQER